MTWRLSTTTTTISLVFSAASVALWCRSVRDVDWFHYNARDGTEYYLGTQPHVLVLSRFMHKQKYCEAFDEEWGAGWSYTSVNYRHEAEEISRLLAASHQTPDVATSDEISSPHAWNLFLLAREVEPVAFFGQRQPWISPLGFGWDKIEWRLQGDTPISARRYALALPLWLIALLFLAAASPKILLTIRGVRRRAKHRCIHCGYDLRATPHLCPECGAVPSESLDPSASRNGPR